MVSRERVEKLSGLLGPQNRRLAALDYVLGASDCSSWIVGHDLASDEIVKEHTDGSQVLLDGRCGAREVFNVGCHHNRFNPLQSNTAFLAPSEKPRYRSSIRKS